MGWAVCIMCLLMSRSSYTFGLDEFCDALTPKEKDLIDCKKGMLYRHRMYQIII